MGAPALRGPHAVFLLRPLDHHAFGAVHSGRLVAPDVRVLSAPVRHGAATEPPALGRVSPLNRLLLSIAFLFLLTIAGLGWVRALMPRLATVLQAALAPGVGAGVLVLGLAAADALGFRLEHSAVWVCPVVAISGLFAWMAATRPARPSSPPARSRRIPLP